MRIITIMLFASIMWAAIALVFVLTWSQVMQ